MLGRVVRTGVRMGGGGGRGQVGATRVRRDEFEKLALEHMDAVYRLAITLTRDPDEASDLVQDVYLRALRPATVERFEDRSTDEQGTGGIRSWLFTICHNVFYSRRKKAGRRPIAVDEFFNESADGPAPDDAGPVWDRAHLDWEHVDERLKAAIGELKDEHREVLLMWAVDGLKYREIAEIMEVPIGTVMSRLHRARKLLMDRLTRGEDALTEDIGLPGRGVPEGEDGED